MTVPRVVRTRDPQSGILDQRNIRSTLGRAQEHTRYAAGFAPEHRLGPFTKIQSGECYRDLSKIMPDLNARNKFQRTSLDISSVTVPAHSSRTFTHISLWLAVRAEGRQADLAMLMIPSALHQFAPFRMGVIGLLHVYAAALLEPDPVSDFKSGPLPLATAIKHNVSTRSPVAV